MMLKLTFVLAVTAVHGVDVARRRTASDVSLMMSGVSQAQFEIPHDKDVRAAEGTGTGDSMITVSMGGKMPQILEVPEHDEQMKDTKQEEVTMQGFDAMEMPDSSEMKEMMKAMSEDMKKGMPKALHPFMDQMMGTVVDTQNGQIVDMIKAAMQSSVDPADYAKANSDKLDDTVKSMLRSVTEDDPEHQGQYKLNPEFDASLAAAGQQLFGDVQARGFDEAATKVSVAKETLQNAQETLQNAQAALKEKEQTVHQDDMQIDSSQDPYAEEKAKLQEAKEKLQEAEGNLQRAQAEMERATAEVHESMMKKMFAAPDADTDMSELLSKPASADNEEELKSLMESFQDIIGQANDGDDAAPMNEEEMFASLQNLLAKFDTPVKEQTVHQDDMQIDSKTQKGTDGVIELIDQFDNIQVHGGEEKKKDDEMDELIQDFDKIMTFKE